MRIGLLCTNRNWVDPTEPYQAIAEGLKKLGHTASPLGCPPTSAACHQLWSKEPDAIFIWGVNGAKRSVGDDFRRRGKPAFTMERGFFDRYNYTQIDHVGFNCSASWTPTLHAPAPAVGAKRFRAAWGKPPEGFGPREGYCLVLLQVPGDAQLKATKFPHPGPFVRAVDRAAPPGVKIRVRAHPLSQWNCGERGSAVRMIEGSLAEAIGGAKYAVTINSNAGNECLALGCPVLCMGPALYEMVGLALRATPGDLALRLAEMDAGWRPDDDETRNYLAHLACRQWTCDELATGEPLRMILDAAM